MRVRRGQRKATIFVAVCVSLAAAGVAIGHAQAANWAAPQSSSSAPAIHLAQYTIPESPEIPISPATPGTLPGTTAGSTSVGTNPITGQPCSGQGATSLLGGTDEEAGDLGNPDTTPEGLPPVQSIYGTTSGLGAC